jgi:hypothetical protein
MNWVLIMFVLLVLVHIAASIWFLVAAFRVGVLWGICTLLIPGAALVFLIVHWSEARAPFSVCLLTSVAAVGIFFYAEDARADALAFLLNDGFMGMGEKVNTGDDPEKPSALVDTWVEATRGQDQLALKRLELEQLAMEMNQRYADLQSRQATLDTRDAAAVQAFNAEAARYHEVRLQVAARKAELDAGGSTAAPSSPGASR